MSSLRFSKTAIFIITGIFLTLSACIIEEEQSVYVNFDGDMPEFSWDGAVDRLTVYESRPNQPEVSWSVWTLVCPGNARCLVGPVVYGDTPEGAVLHEEPEPLTSNRSYRVELERMDGSDKVHYAEGRFDLE